MQDDGGRVCEKLGNGELEVLVARGVGSIDCVEWHAE